MTTLDDRGRGAKTPAEIPARGWKDILWRVYAEITTDNVMLIAAGVTFYLLLALFPALAAFVSFYGFFADPGEITGHLSAIEEILPRDGAAIIQTQLASLADQQDGALTFGFVLSLLIAFWSANSGMKAIIEALNIAYEEQEKRSYVRLTLVSFAFTVGAFTVAIGMILAVGVLPAVFAVVNLSGMGELLLRILRWPVLLVIVAGGLAVLYRYGPSRETADWRWVTWGSAFATLVWLASSVALTIYLENFADYNATYGSLGALMGLLLWIWTSTLVVLVGAELNAEMEHQTAEDTTGEPKTEMGRRGARVADTLGATSD